MCLLPIFMFSLDKCLLSFSDILTGLSAGKWTFQGEGTFPLLKVPPRDGGPILIPFFLSSFQATWWSFLQLWIYEIFWHRSAGVLWRLFLEEWEWKSLSRVRLFATPWTIQSMEFSRPEYRSGYSLFLLQGILPTQGSNPGLLHCGWILYQLSHKGSL